MNITRVFVYDLSDDYLRELLIYIMTEKVQKFNYDFLFFINN